MKSFKNYIKQRFDNEFWEVAEKYINSDFDKTELSYHRLRKAGEVEIDNINIEHIWCSNMPDMKIKFDVAFSISLQVHEGNHRYDDYEEKNIWLLSECEGDIEKNFDDFIIKDTYPYNGKSRNTTPMDDSLVPIISRDELEDVAKEILTMHFPIALEKPTYLDPMMFANILGLSVEHCTLTNDGSIFGQCFFEDTTTKIYSTSASNYIEKKVKARTVLIDPNASFLYNPGVINNTIIHECIHWILHRKSFMLAKLYNDTLTGISCEVTGGFTGANTSPLDWMEWQANVLTPKLQMPREMFIKKAKEIESSIWNRYPVTNALDVIEGLIDELAIFFGVSRLAAKIRLVECGFDIARGAFIYVDGKYVKPHKTTKPNIIKNDETFCISSVDLALLKYTDPVFNKKIIDGHYTYVDSHVVLNLPLYVTLDEAGNQMLTPYARKHMEECCLVFKLSIKTKTGSKYRTECFLNRDKHSTIDFNIVFHDGFENSTPDKQQKKLQETIEEEYSVYSNLTSNYVDSLNTCKKWRKLTNKEIAERSGLNHETVGRCLKGELSRLETIILICLAMHLPYRISTKIINDCPHNLIMNNVNHQYYDFVLTHLYSKPISEIRQFLSKNKVEPL